MIHFWFEVNQIVGWPLGQQKIEISLILLLTWSKNPISGINITIIKEWHTPHNIH